MEAAAGKDPSSSTVVTCIRTQVKRGICVASVEFERSSLAMQWHRAGEVQI